MYEKGANSVLTEDSKAILIVKKQAGGYKLQRGVGYIIYVVNISGCMSDKLSELSAAYLSH